MHDRGFLFISESGSWDSESTRRSGAGGHVHRPQRVGLRAWGVVDTRGYVCGRLQCARLRESGGVCVISVSSGDGFVSPALLRVYCTETMKAR